jgi:hypothetical protein
MMRSAAIAGLALIALAGCTTYRDRAAVDRFLKARNQAFQQFDAKSCIAKGGVVKGVCMFGFPDCVVSYADGGKACSDKADCMGSCEVEGEFVKPGTAVTGRCVANSEPCGCRQTISGGKAEEALCAD